VFTFLAISQHFNSTFAALKKQPDSDLKRSASNLDTLLY
jgi:hypothetical protein